MTDVINLAINLDPFSFLKNNPVNINYNIKFNSVLIHIITRYKDFELKAI